MQATEPTQATGDSPAATGVMLDADQMHRGPVASAAAAAQHRTDSLRMEEVPAARTAADMPAAVVVIVAADTAAGANSPSVVTVPSQFKAPLACERGFLAVLELMYNDELTAS